MVREAYTVLNAPLPKTSSNWRNETEKQLRIISFWIHRNPINIVTEFKCQYHIFINRNQLPKCKSKSLPKKEKERVNKIREIAPVNISQSDRSPQNHYSHNPISHRSNQHSNPFLKQRQKNPPKETIFRRKRFSQNTIKASWF